MVKRVCAIKNVLDIMPMETDTIEFNANADGDWFFHCHILYHDGRDEQGI
jgi:FtsP/CotA-like multicopper oxidase with cupredoxin domain